MVYVAGEPIPFFWPMRTFIHHNPLHGLEGLPFNEAVRKGSRLFHGRGFLERKEYQRYLKQGEADRGALGSVVDAYVAGKPSIADIDMAHWLMTLLTKTETRMIHTGVLAGPEDVFNEIHGAAPTAGDPVDLAAIRQSLRENLLDNRPVYESIDVLYGTNIATELDELVIKSCLDFFDEGQSVFRMPGREQGLFAAWRDLAERNARLFLRGLDIKTLLMSETSPENIIVSVLQALGVPEGKWVDYFSAELAELHGWAGFIRWRANARHYYWSDRYPADLVDFLAIRLTLALALIAERGRSGVPTNRASIERAIDDRPQETWLRLELFGGTILPAYARRVEQALARGNRDQIEALFGEYTAVKRRHEASSQAQRLQEMGDLTGEGDALRALSRDQFAGLLSALQDAEDDEGMLWLRVMEKKAMDRVLQNVNMGALPPREKRPFAQALFCIDTRSERIRRHLEGAGDYQTFGIAGFFGVPISFMELGKGSETHRCPVLLTPKNLVLEIAAEPAEDMHAVTAFEKLLHELKESVLTPYVTVEAIGMLFGLDMVGKTLMPQRYNRWRKKLYRAKPSTHLLLDKLDREQADSIVRAVQRSMVALAIETEFGLIHEAITDDMVRELREAALGHATAAPILREACRLDAAQEQAFIARLRKVYRVDPAFARLQMEQLGRIGFSNDQQAVYVAQALSSIGLTQDFSRFVLLVGHGSTSENNPYESALDCGACAGNHGLTNARVLAQMANKTQVRNRLREQGINIPDDAWFIPAMHDTTTDEIRLYDLDRIPSSHVVYLDRLRGGLTSASRLCAQERMPELQPVPEALGPGAANRMAQRNAMDWSQVRPEWGLAGNAYFIIGRRNLTRHLALDGRAFMHSYDYRIDPKQRLLESILSGPLVVAQWINMEHYFSTVDNERFGSGSKVYHNVAGRFGVMTGNLSDLRTGLPSQTVLQQGRSYHQPIRLVTMIEAPFEHASRAIENVAAVKNLVRHGWIRMVIIDSEKNMAHIYDNDEWRQQPLATFSEAQPMESRAS